MEFETTSLAFGGEQHISKWDSERIRRLGADDLKQLTHILDVFGKKSAVAQGLNAPVTDVCKLRNTDQRLYTYMYRQSTKTVLLGGLKVGTKKLFLRTASSELREVQPVCVLDFYVHESSQRQGVGKQLFEHFLAAEGVHPACLAYDRPSPKLIAFLRKHYGLTDYMPQSNNYVVFSDFWAMNPTAGLSGRSGRGVHPLMPGSRSTGVPQTSPLNAGPAAAVASHHGRQQSPAGFSGRGTVPYGSSSTSPYPSTSSSPYGSTAPYASAQPSPYGASAAGAAGGPALPSPLHAHLAPIYTGSASGLGHGQQHQRLMPYPSSPSLQQQSPSFSQQPQPNQQQTWPGGTHPGPPLASASPAMLPAAGNGSGPLGLTPSHHQQSEAQGHHSHSLRPGLQSLPGGTGSPGYDALDAFAAISGVQGTSQAGPAASDRLTGPLAGAGGMVGLGSAAAAAAALDVTPMMHQQQQSQGYHFRPPWAMDLVPSQPPSTSASPSGISTSGQAQQTGLGRSPSFGRRARLGSSNSSISGNSIGGAGGGGLGAILSGDGPHSRALHDQLAAMQLGGGGGGGSGRVLAGAAAAGSSAQLLTPPGQGRAQAQRYGSTTGGPVGGAGTPGSVPGKAGQQAHVMAVAQRSGAGAADCLVW